MFNFIFSVLYVALCIYGFYVFIQLRKVTKKVAEFATELEKKIEEMENE